MKTRKIKGEKDSEKDSAKVQRTVAAKAKKAAYNKAYREKHKTALIDKKIELYGQKVVEKVVENLDKEISYIANIGFTVLRTVGLITR